MIATHDAAEVALAILARKHKRLKAKLNRLPMPRAEVSWRGLVIMWSDRFPASREEPRNTK